MTHITTTKTPKDPTGALRQRRARARRKAELTVTTPSVTFEKRNDLKAGVTAVTAPVTARVEVLPPHPPRRLWSAIGRTAVGAAIICAGIGIVITSIRANAWFGHELTPNPTAGEIYARLSILAEILTALIPTAIRFYWSSGEPRTALRGWLLMAVALIVVFFAAGGFAITNINSGMEARAERQTGEVQLAQRRLDTLSQSRDVECRKRGLECRRLEREEQDAIASLDKARAEVKASAEPQAAALGVSRSLHLVQAGAMVAFCLFSGLFISFGAGLIWPR
jgi:hypothetical protein